MPWRRRRSPYRVWLSEMMLQQTSIPRVEAPYRAFVARFPSFAALGRAAPAEVLAAWKGLGYNRRALALLAAARLVSRRHGGRLPRTMDGLVALPGIGPATAAAILVYAFDLPVAFIETNVRRVYLHFFFPRRTGVRDADIMPVVERTMDRRNPRDWFYALMDYGTWLARQGGNANLRSAVYKPQSRFKGSRREVRGRVIAVLLEKGRATRAQLEDLLEAALDRKDERLDGVLRDLEEEGFLQKSRDRFSLR
jgi:A/G-specific adenine glycosylase